MHLVLQIPEVLLNIFCHLAPSSKKDRKSSDLAALARTCRAFKEPALDILWSELHDPSPLSRCLPEISCEIPPDTQWDRFYYSFTRPLERAEWDILCSYARRVWCIHNSKIELDWGPLTETSTDFIPAGPLFPNLRSLHCEFTDETISLFYLPFPSLIHLDIYFFSEENLYMFQDPLESLVKTSPNIKILDIRCEDEFEPESSEVVSDGICGWSNLEMLICPQIFLDVDALVHLSRMPALTQLTFRLSETFLEQIAPSDPLCFSNLEHLELYTESLTPISKLLSWTRLPAISDFSIIIDSCPSKQDLASFMDGIQMAGMDRTIQEFNLDQVHDDPEDIELRDTDAPLLELGDLWPCMAFHRLRLMNVDLEWNVGLSDDELLTLVSALPRLEELLINTNWGWDRPGITPNGLALLLETCPSLTSIALAIDTRGYTQFPARQFREPVSPSSFDRPFRINVLDSVIKRESVDAMAAFFARVVPHFDLVLTSWKVESMNRKYWGRVQSRARERMKKRWLNVLRELFFPTQV